MNKKNLEDVIGNCANCGSEDLNYGEGYLDDDEYVFPYTCGKCKAQGEESYFLDFSTNRIN